MEPKMALDENFAVFILTHGRPDKVKTYKMLKSQGYTGKVYFIIDNEDKRADQYYKNFGDKVIMFDKLAESKRFDTGDNFEDRRTVVYARNASFDIARQLGIEYFLVLDDDYIRFAYKFTSSLEYRDRKCLNLNKLFDIVLEYYKKNKTISTISYAQGGDAFGGELKKIYLKRKAMNSFFCSTSRPFKFVGRINEDVNAYTSEGNRGKLFFMLFSGVVHQTPTQQNAGGMTDVYLNGGTYIKSFYSVMYCPSSVKVSSMSTSNARIHHRIAWKNTVPCILRESIKKQELASNAREA